MSPLNLLSLHSKGTSTRGRAALVAVAVGLAILVELSVLQEVTLTISAKSTDSTSRVPPRVYTVTFYSGGFCNGGSAETWGVTLGNMTKTQPSNATIAQAEDNYRWGFPGTPSAISFSVPSGEYPYRIYPSTSFTLSAPNGAFRGGSQGMVTVSDLNVTICTNSYFLQT